MGKRMSVEDFRKDHPRAVVFDQQPTEFEIMETPEELKKWEEQLLDELGLSSLKGIGGKCTATACYCLGRKGADDCDCV